MANKSLVFQLVAVIFIAGGAQQGQCDPATNNSISLIKPIANCVDHYWRRSPQKFILTLGAISIAAIHVGLCARRAEDNSTSFAQCLLTFNYLKSFLPAVKPPESFYALPTETQATSTTTATTKETPGIEVEWSSMKLLVLVPILICLLLIVVVSIALYRVSGPNGGHTRTIKALLDRRQRKRRTTHHDSTNRSTDTV